MFQKIAKYIESRYPNKYGEAISLFVANLSIIKLGGLTLLIIWNIVLGSALFNNATLLINGYYTSGTVEDVISSQQVCGRYYDRTCTSYDALIGYSIDNAHHTFESDIIGRVPIGRVFTIIVNPGNQEVYTLIGIMIVSGGIIWQICIFIPIYLMIQENIREMMQRGQGGMVDRTSYSTWMQRWAFGMLLSAFFITSIFLYFQGNHATLYVLIFFVCIIMYQLKDRFIGK